MKDKSVFQTQPFSSPDACSAKGQKLDPWSVDWDWSSSDEKVATITTFSTKGANKFCTTKCVKKGSDLPAGSALLPLCGNGIIEAGEDCDDPDKSKGCSLSCRFTGNADTNTCGNGKVDPELGEACDPKDQQTLIGCSATCLRRGSEIATVAKDTSASICGNGLIGSGEDCDLGIDGKVGNSLSALGCSAKCLHLGAKLSSKWCFDHSIDRGSFSAAEYEAACVRSFSQCGDGSNSPDKDAGCDLGNGKRAAWCNDYCLVNNKSHAKCTPGNEGCSENGQYLGSSLLYSTASACADEIDGIGEDPFCETSLGSKHAGLINPWVLATGVGLGATAGDPPVQTTAIKSETSQNTKGGVVGAAGKFSIVCGFQNDAECADAYGDSYGVGSNSCCMLKPFLQSTYPADAAANVCSNTYLEAVFDETIDQASLKDNLLIARGLYTGSAGCAAENDVTGLIAQATEATLAQSWYEKAVTFLRHLLGSSAEAGPTIPSSWCVGQDLGTGTVVAGTSAGSSIVTVQLSSPLATSTDYAIILKDGIKDKRGVSIGKDNLGKVIQWKFVTGPKLCEINKVTVSPPQVYFSKAGATADLTAKTAAAGGVFIQSIPGFYEWEYLWGPVNPFVTLSSTTSSLNTITAENHNGEVDIRASANLTANKDSGTLGIAATGKSHAIVFLCENPWPPKELILKNGDGPYVVFPYEDKVSNNDGFNLSSNVFDNTAIPSSPLGGYFNFSTYYCADNGSHGTFDDLPLLRPVVQVANTIVSTSSSLKRFIFTNEKNDDVIGIQVFPNPNHLTAEEWYSGKKLAGGQEFAGQIQKSKVDGYSAVTDGNNVYVDAVNYSDPVKSLYTNVYLFSINADATSETRKIFDALLTNIKFNSNVNNYGYCGATIDNPNFDKTCSNDLECPNGQVCASAVDKLKRNYQRLRDLNGIQTALTTYTDSNLNKFPDLKEGTYLTGQTLSVWPSWAVLSNAVGTGLPLDPVNQLAAAGTCAKSTSVFCTTDAQCPNNEKCTLHDPATAWSTEDRRFSFACATSSYAYRYLADPKTGYTVRTHFEDTGLTINNYKGFVSGFVDLTRIIVNDPNGICNQDQEISTLNSGTCGDGQVNLNKEEECDPPGKVRYGACSDEKRNQVKVDVCSSSCGWVASSTPYISCSSLSKCGDGAVGIGEVCDDGVLNGKYNHCNNSCQGMSTLGICGDGILQQKYELCEVKDASAAGWCSGGINNGRSCNVNSDCNNPQGGGGGIFIGRGVRNQYQSFAGQCMLVSATKVKYNAAKPSSCSFDCQAAGPYCGDKIVQPEFGEQCEGNTTCSVAGQTGARQCDAATCAWTDTKAVAWWRLDDGSKNSLLDIPTIVFTDSSGQNSGSCSGTCPTFTTQGKIKNSFVFNGKSTSITVPDAPALKPADAISIEAWINPSGDPAAWTRILEKGGFQVGGGYDLEFNQDGYPGFVAWATSIDSLPVYANSVIPPDEWTHIVGTFERKGNEQISSIYINGVLENKAIKINSVAQFLAPNTQPLIIGRAGRGSADFFAGSIDEVKIYDRVLIAEEVKDHFINAGTCQATIPDSVAVTAAMCGDGNVDSNEACDNVQNNGIKCTPSYNKACSYCSADCKNVIDVQPQQYCGNGIIEATEKCDALGSGGTVYAAAADVTSTASNLDTQHNGYQALSCVDELQNPYTVKKGTKGCTNNCSFLAANCTVCGIDKNGEKVSGKIVNVLEPASGNPLYGEHKPLKTLENGIEFIRGYEDLDGRIDLFIASAFDPNRLVGAVAWLHDSQAGYSLHPPADNAFDSLVSSLINANPLCSSGEPHYRMRVNEDSAVDHFIDFPVIADPKNLQPWRYDLLLSPVIVQSIRPNDIRVVVTWVGNTSFTSGFTIPSTNNSNMLEGASFTPPPPPPQGGGGGNQQIINPFGGSVNPFIAGRRYYTAGSTYSIWYHGASTTVNRITEESFSVNTAGLKEDQYAFYVRTSANDPIKNLKITAKLKVDIYVPENDNDERHFARPTKTFYLNSAAPGDNPNASYWYVANIQNKSVNSGVPADRIIEVNKLITDFSKIQL